MSKSPLLDDPPVSSSTRVGDLPLRKIPGSYGLPFFGPLLDRFCYFYCQGEVKFFKSRVQKYQSTVFRANMPPGPFVSSDSKVVVLLDAKSFPILFDMTKVEKKDVFLGTFMPSTKLTGGYRVLAYLDPSEPNHSKLKQLVFNLIHSRSEFIIPEFRKSYGELFDTVDSDLAAKGKAQFDAPTGGPNEKASFNFLARSLLGVNPADTELGSDGAPLRILSWLIFQIGPIAPVGLPFFIEDPLFHTFRLPPCLVKCFYQKLYDFFYKYAGSFLDEGEKMGIKRDEVCHNLLFVICFNAFSGMKVFFPNIVKSICRLDSKIQKQLIDEVRSAVKSSGGNVTMKAIEEMPLVKSVIYEVMRMQPAVPYQYAKAKEDFVIESHESAFQVKKGEMLFGFQPIVTKDPKVFERAEEFVADRFVGVEGEKLLKYVVWSNGPETENPSVDNKQCPGKDLVVLFSRLLVVELFLRYDSVEAKLGSSQLCPQVTFTSLKKANAQG
ncbi:hypothetical protein MKW94_008784 [Papaver nudicaule]|uniref:Allene oxide synthase n=1 Tax=Papaver nudicaule TaxID=74823 RepID=A0AA41V5R4_PAPNU|nr:hypothetical protein [Papaver nudicaule]